MSQTSEEQKRAVAVAARDYVADTWIHGAILGVGTGTTAAAFIAELAAIRDRLGGAVASSEATHRALTALGIRCLDLNDVDELPLYVDGADEVTDALVMCKGGGGAHTREKIVAAAAREMLCIADASKRVAKLGGRPVPVEVIPMARTYVAKRISLLGGEARVRSGFVTDNGNTIVDVHGLDLHDPIASEIALEQLTGVVACGLFARRPADRLFVTDGDSVVRIVRPHG